MLFTISNRYIIRPLLENNVTTDTIVGYRIYATYQS